MNRGQLHVTTPSRSSSLVTTTASRHRLPPISATGLRQWHCLAGFELMAGAAAGRLTRLRSQPEARAMFSPPRRRRAADGRRRDFLLEQATASRRAIRNWCHFTIQGNRPPRILQPLLFTPPMPPPTDVRRHCQHIASSLYRNTECSSEQQYQYQ